MQRHVAREFHGGQLDVLGHHKEIGEHRRSSIADRALFESHLPLLWAQQSGHEINQCRFSGAVLPEQAHNSPGGEVKGDVAEHLIRAVAVAKMELLQVNHIVIV